MLSFSIQDSKMELRVHHPDPQHARTLKLVTLEDATLCQAMLEAYLGPKSVTPSLKASILNGCHRA